MGYIFGELRVQDFSHQMFDGLLFCLPAGLLALIAFHRLCPLIFRFLPDVYRRELLPLSQRPLGSPWVLVVSVLIGAVTHLLLDSFTHKNGWMTEHWAVLQFPLFEHGHRTLRVCHILWYLCSFTGITWVCLVYQEWLAKISAPARAATSGARFGNAVLLAVAVMVMSGSHYLTRYWWVNFVEGAFTLLILLVFALRTGTLSKAR